jgi:acetyl-CoA carboxylase biotin carboxylase subunit
VTERLLVANRGEIALRIFRACRELGIETVAVFSDADREAPHVAAADYGVRIGPPPARESYLSVPALLDAARRTGARLVHPGYGFLSENGAFARACREAGLVFVGPTPEAIEEMGSKTRARSLAVRAGVPVVPGTEGPVADASELERFARDAGYPILLKAAAGGGGKGMRRVESASELAPSLARVAAEAEASFADGSVYAEKLIERPRHVEVQVVGDSSGRLVAIGERECSIQRRHQKVVEECPSPAVDEQLRAELLRAAVAVARAANYVSCGTVEFLLAPDRRFYFLEMNTRLQVEHTVTEEVWGVDLAVAMIRIALGAPLSEDLLTASPRGHAIECRIYAEDPRRGFAPSPGRIRSLRLPEGPGVRNDVGVEAGSTVPIDYDAMLGKLIVHGRDREAARVRLARALTEYEVGGLETTIPLFRAIAADPEFSQGEVDVQWLDRRLAADLLEREAPPEEIVWLAALGIDGPSANGRSAPRREAASLWRRTARREGLRD